MPDLETQLTEYCRQLDERFVDVAFEEIVWAKDRAPRRPLRVMLAAAAVVLALVGGAALLLRVFREPVVPVSDPTTTTTTTVATTTTTAPATTTASAPTTTVPPVVEPWSTVRINDGEIVVADWNPPIVWDRSGHLVTAVVEEETVELIRCLDPTCEERTNKHLDLNVLDLALALDPNDLPVVVYQDVDFRIQVALCEDPLCESHSSHQLSETFSWPHVQVSQHPEGGVVVGLQYGDGYPRLFRCVAGSCDDSGTQVMAFEDQAGSALHSLVHGLPSDGRPVLLASQSNGLLRFARCVDQGCSAVDEVVLNGSGGSEDTASLVLGSDGLPFGAAYVGGRLNVFKCRDLGCEELGAFSDFGPAEADFKASVAPSIAMGPDGSPNVAYWDEHGTVVIAVCQDPGCESFTVVPFGRAGSHTLSFAQDGRPVLLYHTSSVLMLARCVAPTCLVGTVPADAPEPAPAGGGVTEATIHPQATAGFGIGMTMDAAGLPVFAYADGDGTAWLTRCLDPGCQDQPQDTKITDGIEIIDGALRFSVALDPSGSPHVTWNQGFMPPRTMKLWDGNAVIDVETSDGPLGTVAGDGVVVTGDGAPVLGYHTWVGRGALVMITCADPACATSRRTVVDDRPDPASGDYVFFSMDMTTDRARNPILAYDNGVVRIATCGDPSCAEPHVATLDEIPSGMRLSVVSDVAGLPLVLASKHSAEDPFAALIRCHDLACGERTVTEVTELTEAAARGTLGRTQLVIGADDLPTIIWLDWSTEVLKLVTCADPVCSARTSSQLGVNAGRSELVAVAAADGLPAMALFDGSRLRFVRCLDKECGGSG